VGALVIKNSCIVISAIVGTAITDADENSPSMGMRMRIQRSRRKKRKKKEHRLFYYYYYFTCWY
jgi:hypothetical protein